MPMSRARFSVGQIVQHRFFGYRGVIVDVDATFQGRDDWYKARARTRPPKNRPWYHVLVHDASHMTYVAERNMEPDLSGEPIDHPATRLYFDELREGHYIPHDPIH